MSTPVDTDARREALRHHWQERVPFNRLCDFRVTRWTDSGVTMTASYEERLSNSKGSLHGGVLAALMDTAANGAVAAGDDYLPESGVSTIGMSLQYLAAITGDVVVDAVCTRRGGLLSFVDVVARDADGSVLARGLVTVRVARPKR